MSSRGLRRTLALGAWLLAMGPVAAYAQTDTREAELRRQREEKAKQLAPYEPTRAEKAVLWLENGRTWERLFAPAEGIYPKIGSITPGSGFSLGAGYRKANVLGETGAFSTVVMGSLKRYWLIDARWMLPNFADGAGFTELYVRRFDFPGESFFGIGPDSRRDAQSDFGFRNDIEGVRAGLRVGPLVSVGGSVEHLAPRVDRGRSQPLQDRFPPAAVPGVVLQPDFIHYETTAEVNSRQPRGNPRTGGLYALRHHYFDDRDFDAFNFSRVEGEVQQYLSIFNQRRVLALRGLVSTSTADSGQEVPFYLMRTLGGPDDLRGFRRNRFRDAHLILLQAEYRWEVFTAMDAAIFYDAGKVASRRGDLTLKGLERNYGFGVRFGSDLGVFLRVEGAFGSRDGKHFILRFGDAF